MRHVGLHHRARFAASLTCRGVIDGFIQAKFPFQPCCGESLQIQARRLGRHHQRQRRGIRRNHQVIGKSAFESQAGHAKGAVLVVEMDVDQFVTGFRHTPRHAALPPILDLPRHRRLIGLVEQRVIKGRHHQQRHQVLEHRTAPRQKNRFAAGAREQPP